MTSILVKRETLERWLEWLWGMHVVPWGMMGQLRTEMQDILAKPAPITGYDGTGECEHCKARKKGCDIAFPRTHGCPWRKDAGEVSLEDAMLEHHRTKDHFSRAEIEKMIADAIGKQWVTPSRSHGYGPQSTAGEYPASLNASVGWKCPDATSPAAMDCNIDAAIATHQAEFHAGESLTRAEIEKMIADALLVERRAERKFFLKVLTGEDAPDGIELVGTRLPSGAEFDYGTALEKAIIGNQRVEIGQMVREALDDRMSRHFRECHTVQTLTDEMYNDPR